ncbi:hypothetical protein MJO28_005956 [Puccinia striiformis f. sp. tritici]|uniref:Uncharacterized protein n=1 Tax=Puccinia striiformis f. sp. tritici TaxID=168172 RepID=A0ACC0EH32_9BASI|nr:hypothetical protein Pst134EB_012170 [Puccinia striiformis f. sp. tritici]KAI7953409.1 hypothetical protein MJO28_005956 [Puccinia striiformis f. sp. tritici]KAI7957753.1 hypothetical protein MJO29_005970 [Puccinia striiformis f. sp. tritici]
MGTYGIRPSGYDSASSSDSDDDSNNGGDARDLLAAKDIEIAELRERLKQFEMEAAANQAQISPGQVNQPTPSSVNGSGCASTSLVKASEFASRGPSTSLVKASESALTIHKETSVDRPKQLQILPADHAGSPSAVSKRPEMTSPNNYEASLIRSTSRTTTLVTRTSLPGPAPNNGIQQHLAVEIRSETSVAQSWTCVKHNAISHDIYGEESDRQDTGESEETGEEGITSDDEDQNPRMQAFRPKLSSGSSTHEHHAMGYDGLSCVIGGNTVTMYNDESSNGEKLKFMGRIPRISTPDGKRDLYVSKAMLHMQDGHLILKDKYSPNSLYNLDIEVGKVVNEWKVGREPLVDFCPREKYSQMSPETTMMGATSDSFFVIDPRKGGDFKGATMSYRTQTKFSCVVTTERGWTAVGSYKGDIRLYDSIGKRAKSWFQGFKGPVLALDVSGDGAYLVATFEAFLVLFDCGIGFNKSISNSVNGCGIMFDLTKAHKSYVSQCDHIPIRYKPAKFNLGPGTLEKIITTTIGPYLIAFNLESILNRKPEYEIKRYQDNVVTDSFRWNNDKDIVVTTPTNVFIQKRSKLSTSHRHSLDSRNNPPSNLVRTGRYSLGSSLQRRG